MTMATTTSSRLLSLPKELRLLIYDFIFEPLVQRPEHFDTVVLPSEWPETDLGTYHSLTLVCKQLHAEAQTHFESQFLGRVIIYFTNVPDLHDFCEAVRNLPEPQKYGGMQICLRTSRYLYHDEELDDDDFLTDCQDTQEEWDEEDALLSIALRDLDFHINWFISTQPGFHKQYDYALSGLCEEDSPCDGPPSAHAVAHHLITHATREGSRVDTIHFPMGRRARPSVKISTHQVCQHGQCAYSTMVCSVQDVVWKNWSESRRAQSVRLRRKVRAMCEGRQIKRLTAGKERLMLERFKECDLRLKELKLQDWWDCDD